MFDSMAALECRLCLLNNRLSAFPVRSTCCLDAACLHHRVSLMETVKKQALLPSDQPLHESCPTLFMTRGERRSMSVNVSVETVESANICDWNSGHDRKYPSLSVFYHQPLCAQLVTIANPSSQRRLRESADPAVASLLPSTRTHSELDSPSDNLASAAPTLSESETLRPHKRQRISTVPNAPIDYLPIRTYPNMRYPGAEEVDESNAEDLVAGPSSQGLDHSGSSNGHTSVNGFSPLANGGSGIMGNGIQKSNGHSKRTPQARPATVSRVTLPGTSLYEGSEVDREEFVRLVVQTLRDVGYVESAATLEAESGYAMESPEIADFRRSILEGHWAEAEAVLQTLTFKTTSAYWGARFMISEQKYLEFLETQNITDALRVLRDELAPLDDDSDHLHFLSSLMMCSEPDDLRRRAAWDGVSGNSRRLLLTELHKFIPASILIPPRRFTTLIDQAIAFQQQRCTYHNTPTIITGPSLFEDHQCDRDSFPGLTTTILHVHTSEVWILEWSRDGARLASSSNDTNVIIWELGADRNWLQRSILGHPYSVICMAWSSDDSILLTGTEHYIKMWNTKTGVCIRTMEKHTEPVTSLVWLPDDSGFLSAGMDFTIISWSKDGLRSEVWDVLPIRLTRMALTPDLTRLVAIGLREPPVVDSRGEGDTGTGGNPPPKEEHRMLVYDLATKRPLSTMLFEGELTSLSISHNSVYALISRSPDDIQLWDIRSGKMVRKYAGHKQSRDIIHSCFGGSESNFVVSGSEDGNIYVWHRDSGALLEVLTGHSPQGSVNCVAWNPRNESMFASCSDDQTIRIWESSSLDLTPESPIPVNGKGKTRQYDDSIEHS
ncbi:unnamed protein product [Mycena citricolor]|uniref:CTLH domain-containing protein n=1 Tax=Mycena citricolor TaxID=2018698 RepID=A0AAD2JW48_9AGAR|nr:unnamed protein product [Mycena citricolor]